jgi:hypothetical protein
VEPCGAKWSQVEPSGAKWSQVEPSGVNRSQVESSGAKWSQVAPSGAKWSQVADERREFHGSLTYRQANAVKNEVSRGGLVQNPVFSCVFSCPCFQNPFFCMFFGKNLQPRRQSTGPRRDQIKPKRPQKHRVLETGCLKQS